MKATWKKEFLEKYSKLTDIEKFTEYSLKFLTRSIRVNTLKISVDELKERLEKKLWRLRNIPWCEEGFWIEGLRFDIGNMLEHTLGYFYIQEAASMIPPVVLDPNKNDAVFDMCASPGSKTSQMAAMMENGGLIIANELKPSRITPLNCNLQRSGVVNAVITCSNALAIKNILFDKILLDAPCSGTGAIRKSLKTIKIWNPNMCLKLANTQKKLLQHGFDLLKENGTIVYSTCTLEPEENELVVDDFLNKNENAKLEPIDIAGLRGKAVEEYDGETLRNEIKNCLRIWPQDYDTEGFFVAKIKKI